MGGRSVALLGAITAAAPRLVLAAAYLGVWLLPGRFEPAFVRGLFLAAILEFFVIHSFPFLQLWAGRLEGGGWRARLGGALVLLFFGAIYLGAAAVVGWVTGSTTPLWTMGGLVVARLGEILFTGEPGVRVAGQRMDSWLRSTVLYIVGLIATSLLPLPALGLTSEAIARFELAGSGTWIDHPQKGLAFGFLYFGACAVLDLRARLAQD